MEPLRPDDPPRIGPFTPLARIGAGGMGRVYLARSRGGRPVAVKVIKSEYADDPRFRTRFQREVDAARTVNGLYTAPVLDAGPEDENPWLATAYIPGPSLQQVVKEHGPLPERSARILGAGIAEALGAIHAAGLIHRDLKPSNVICGPDGPRVIDFGISHAVGGTSLTATGLVVGSPRYASPEQCVANAVAVPASDVFALGGVLVFATTGFPPFGDGPDPVQLYLVVHEQPDLAAVPESLRPVVAACLDKDPARRPSIDELLDELLPPGLATDDWLPEAAAGTLRSYSVPAIVDPQEAIPTHPGIAAQTPAPTKAETVAAADEKTVAKAQPGPTRRRLLTGVVGLAAMGASGGTAWWAAGRRDARHNAAAGTPPTTPDPSTPSPTPTPTPTPSQATATPSAPITVPTKAWSVQLDLTSVNGALARNDLLIGVYQGPVSTGNAPQTVVALDAATGANAWTITLEPSNPISLVPATDATAIYIYSNTAGTVAACGLADGKKMWGGIKTGLPVPTATSVGVNDSMILGILGTTLFVGNIPPFANAAAQVLTALDVTTKKILWTRKGADFFTDKLAGVAVGDMTVNFSIPTEGDLVYVAVADLVSTRIIKALDAATGKVMWSVPFAAHPNGSGTGSGPTVTASGDSVYFTDMHDGALHAYDTVGKWQWTYPGAQSPAAAGAAAAALTRQVAVIDGTLYAADTTLVRAIDAATGKALWGNPYTVASGLVVGPVAAGKAVFIEANTPGSGTGPLTLAALDPVTGQAGWTAGAPANTQGGGTDVLVADQSRLYVISASKQVEAFQLPS